MIRLTGGARYSTKVLKASACVPDKVCAVTYGRIWVVTRYTSVPSRAGVFLLPNFV